MLLIFKCLVNLLIDRKAYKYKLFRPIMDEREFTNKSMGKLQWVVDGMYYRFEPKKLPLDYKPSIKVLKQMSFQNKRFSYYNLLL